MAEHEEDVVFAQYQGATGPERFALELELVRLLQKHAHAVCYQVLRDHRPDLVNTAIYQALKHAKNFRGDSKFSTWFHTIILRRCISVLR